jgi:hypothetical protein
MSRREITLGCLPSHRTSRSSRSVCLPSDFDAHIGVIFLIATLVFVTWSLHATTTPYAPLPRLFSSVYLTGTLNSVAGGGREGGERRG